MWKLFRKPAPVDPEVFESGPPIPARVDWSDPTVRVVRAEHIERDQRLAVLLAASCADSSESVDKFLQLYDRAQQYLEALDKRA